MRHLVLVATDMATEVMVDKVVGLAEVAMEAEAEVVDSVEEEGDGDWMNIGDMKSKEQSH
jgi:hypothetical protein